MIIEVVGLTVDLGTGADRRTVLRAVDLTVSSGEWVTVVGPNGAGKSTLLRALAGLAGYSGSVRLDGLEARTAPGRVRARTVAVVPQLPVIPVGVTVGDYVMLGRTPHLAPLQREGRTDHRVVARTLDLLDLTEFSPRLLTTMSGGELQRAFLARALAQEPTVLLLDEPTSALDIGHQQSVLDLVDRLRRDTGLTVLSTMHDLTLAGGYADRVALLDDGTLVAVGPPAEVLTATWLEQIYRARVEVVPPGTWPGQRGPVIVPIRP